MNRDATEDGMSDRWVISEYNVVEIDRYLIAGKIFNLLIIIATIWIVTCMIEYGRRTRRWRGSSGFSASGLDGGKIYASCIAAIVLSLPRFISTTVLFYVPLIVGALEKCELIMDLTAVGYSIAASPTYYFLWLRQRVIYEHPAVKAVAGCWFNKVSWVQFFILSAAIVGLLCGFTIPASFTWTERGCVSIPPGADARESSTFIDAPNFALGGLLIVMQLTLLGIFIYPMVRMKIAQKRNNVSSTGNDVIAATIRRSITSASIAIFSDALANILTVAVIPRNIPSVLSNNVYDISLFINILCITTTFADNLQMFTVFCRKTKRQSQSSDFVQSDTRSATDL